MDSILQDAIRDARGSWVTNATVADKRWPLRQLHGLYEMLIQNRDELVSAVQTETELPILLAEKGFAVVIEDIANHISKFKARDHIETKHTSQIQTQSVYYQPSGVSLVLADAKKSLCYGIGALAASIAARNTVILASSSTSKVLTILQRVASNYLDASSVHIVSEPILDVKPEQFDHILILDDDASGWSAILHYPHVTVLPLIRGSNIAIVDEGALDVDECARDILANHFPHQPDSNALHAVFVHENNTAQLYNALSRVSITSPSQEHPSDGPNLAHCESLTANIVRADVADIRNELEVTLKAVRKGRILLVAESSSLDLIIDVLGGLGPLGALTVYAAASKKSEEYIETWTRSASFSVNNIRTVSSPGNAQFPIRPEQSSPLLFPVELFMKPRVRLTGQPSLVATTVAEIRKSYENIVQALEAEHPGGRVDFFVQVEYTLKAVASVVGVASLVGLWFGARAVRRRYK